MQLSVECSDLGRTHYTSEWHNAGGSFHQEQAYTVHVHLNEKRYSFDGCMHILHTDNWWFDRGVKEAIYVHLELPSLSRN